MKQNVNPVSRGCWLALLAMCLVSLVAHLGVYPQLPDVVPTHWDVGGEVDGWAPKAQSLLIDVLPLVLLALLRVVPSLDPKGHAYLRSGRVYEGFTVLITVFIAAMTWLPEATVFGWLPQGMSTGLVVPVLLGVIFVAMGNYMPRIRQNYTFGIKTPWTLDSPENWRKTQRVGGVWFIVTGIAFIAAGLLGGGALWFGVAIAVCLLGLLVTLGYSYALWRKARQGE